MVDRSVLSTIEEVAKLRAPVGPALLVDDLPDAVALFPDVASLSSTGVPPEELWAVTARPSFGLAVVFKPRAARDLYRVLSLLEPFVLPGGSVLVLPYAPPDGGGGENRFEATELFLGVYGQGGAWERRLLSAGVVEIQKRTAVEATPDPEPPRGSTSPPHPALRPLAPATPSKAAPPAAGKRVISLAVWGDAHYGQYLGAYVRAHLALFPGYVLRIHHDESLYRTNYGGTLLGLRDRGLVELAHMPSRPGQGKCERMLHRFAPAWDPDVDYVFSRDVDALPTWRERCAVEEFIAAAEKGDVNFHTILDNIAHCGIMGGLSGARAETLRSLWPSFDAFVASAGFSDARWAEHGADQDFLNSKVGPKVRVFEHAVFRAFLDDGVTPFARERPTVEEAVKFTTDIAPFSDPAVPEALRGISGSFINYMGTAGYDHARATMHYDAAAPSSGVVRSAEWEADEAATGTSLSPVAPWVVLSSDPSEKYAFFTPLTTLAWRARGYRPLLLLTGEAMDWLADPRYRRALELSRRCGAVVHFVGHHPPFAAATVAQLSRIYGALASGVESGDYLLTSDVDMWPAGAWVGGGRDEMKAVQVYYANAYAEASHVQYPICYLGARAGIWREIVGGGGLREGLARGFSELARDLAAPSADNLEARTWNFDERYFGRLLSAWSGYPERCQMIDRDMWRAGEVRLDRSAWHVPPTLEVYADVHLPRPGFSEENWPSIREVLSLVVGGEVPRWVDEYRELWVRA